MTRVATPHNEEYLLMIARRGTAAQVDNLVQSCRTITTWCVQVALV
ncbi:MAG: hypothetical protein OEN20_11205 [Gammaproteobacteria bacterium]|nr:hypothetical protein [Gammaproteobacteria bacterium]